VAREIVNKFNILNDIDRKIEIFINMLNGGNVQILKGRNKETLEGYPDINLSYFLKNNKDIIQQKLFEELKDNPKYDVAREIVNKFNILNDIDRKIEIFINMLNKGNDTILKQGNKEILEGYPNIKLSQFWTNHKEKIKQKLFIELKDNPKYDIARKLINIHEMNSNLKNIFLIFINMLNKGNCEILKTKSKETLEGYPDINLSHFYHNNKDIIIQKLFAELKENSEYDVARRLIKEFEMSNDIDAKIEAFIEMLNEGNSKILKKYNKETLKGYPNIKLSQFWNNHKMQIKHKLFIELKNNPKYDIARKIINKNEIMINVDNQIPIFINMLNQGNCVILKQGNKETLEGYPNISLSHFYQNNKDRIIQKLFVELKDNPKYNRARELININEIAISIDAQIPIFINMLNRGNFKILKWNNKEILEGYPSINLSHFWCHYKERIIKKLFVELKDDSEYNVARQTVLTYFKVSTIEEYQQQLKEKQIKSQQLKELKRLKNMLESIEQNTGKTRNRAS